MGQTFKNERLFLSSYTTVCKTLLRLCDVNHRYGKRHRLSPSYRYISYELRHRAERPALLRPSAPFSLPPPKVYLLTHSSFIIRNISEDNLKHTALDVLNGFCLFFGKAAMPGRTSVFQNWSDYSLIVIDKVYYSAQSAAVSV